MAPPTLAPLLPPNVLPYYIPYYRGTTVLQYYPALFRPRLLLSSGHDSFHCWVAVTSFHLAEPPAKLLNDCSGHRASAFVFLRLDMITVHKECRVRTFSNHIIAKIARCVEFFHMSSGWFDSTELSRTTSLQAKQGVQGAYAIVQGCSSALNLLEPSRTTSLQR